MPRSSAARRGGGETEESTPSTARRSRPKRQGSTADHAGQDAATAPSSKKKAKKVKVMGLSGQTDAERRVLRAQQRSLQKQITSEVGDSMEDPNSGVFEDVRTSNNELWDDVRYAREAVLDGENLDLISSRAARQVDRLLQVPRYDAVKLIRKLRLKCNRPNKTFNWKKLGQAAGTCFNSVPTNVVSFLNGPMFEDYVPKERKKPARRKRTVAVEEEEDNDEENDKNNKTSAADKLSAVEKQMVDVTKTLRNRCQEEAERQQAELERERPHLDPQEKKKEIKRIEKTNNICAVQYLFNPHSFTQTVENIFNFSFLVKKGVAKISIKKDGEDERPRPVVTAMKPLENKPPRQAVIAFDMQDWRDMCENFQVEKGDIPHRTGSSHTAPPASDEDEE